MEFFDLLAEKQELPAYMKTPSDEPEANIDSESEYDSEEDSDYDPEYDSENFETDEESVEVEANPADWVDSDSEDVFYVEESEP